MFSKRHAEITAICRESWDTINSDYVMKCENISVTSDKNARQWSSGCAGRSDRSRTHLDTHCRCHCVLHWPCPYTGVLPSRIVTCCQALQRTKPCKNVPVDFLVTFMYIRADKPVLLSFITRPSVWLKNGNKLPTHLAWKLWCSFIADKIVLFQS
jgi:hypothetical protein